MRYILCFLLSVFIFCSNAQALKKDQLLKLQQNHLLVKSDVQDIDNNRQSLDFEIIGLHTQKCQKALSKLQQYENYEKFLNLVKKSTYDEKSKIIYLLLDHTLMPFKMSLSFKLERITKEGMYQFQFDNGFLKDLKGLISVSSIDKRCLFHTTSKWDGPHSGINSTVFSFFVKQLAKITMEILFKVSQTY